MDSQAVADEKKAPEKGINRCFCLWYYTFDAEYYDRIVFGFHVWAGNITPPIRTFVKDNDLKGKRIAAFACQSGSGAEKAVGKLKAAIGIDDLENDVYPSDMHTFDMSESESDVSRQVIRTFEEKSEIEE